MIKTKSMFRLALALGVLGAAGCATAGMPVPEALSAAPEWRVRMRNHWRPDSPLLVGPFEAHRIDHQGVRQRGGVLDVLKGKKEYQQRYRFLVRDSAAGPDLWAVECDNRDVEQGVRLGSVELSLDDRTSLECSIQAPGDSARAWSLRMRGSGDGVPTGSVRRGELGYDIVGEDASLQTDCCRPVGYMVRREGRLLGALENAHRGWVRVSPEVGPEEGSLLAAVFAALVLQGQLIQKS
ncbi:MAG: hypothetical protein ICV87_04180 [Gemmatimonadetes bacterium]|nr:hypothetical protein [Gemmatimonadota bacterium]